tara:strand:+ start:128 stop:280 length:153 start_codon:yes stop_codon:yes gene_type:complete
MVINIICKPFKIYFKGLGKGYVGGVAEVRYNMNKDERFGAKRPVHPCHLG